MAADENKTTSNNKLPLITRLKLTVLDFFWHASQRPDGTVNRRILNIVNFRISAPATRLVNKTIVSFSDITVDPSRNLWLRLYIPRTTKLMPLILYFHGGGYTSFGPDTQSYHDICCLLAAEAPAIIASVGYRLAPEHRCPSQYEDGFDALKFIDAQNDAILPDNTDLGRCFIGGDSSGGNIAHHVAFRASQKSHEFGKVKVVGLLAIMPFFGGEARMESELRLTKDPLVNTRKTDWMWKRFLPEDADRDHEAANIFGAKPTTEMMKNADFPSVLVLQGGNDPLQDWHQKYVHWLEHCGKQVKSIKYPNAFHGFYGFPEIPGTDLVIKDLADFVQTTAHCN